MNDRVTFDHYSVCRREDGTLWELGRGAMGITYKAEDVNLAFPVALKVISAACFDDQVNRDRFVREARAAALLRHRNIASVYHLGTDRNHYFYAMEFVEGETAQSLVDRVGPMRPKMALQVALQVASALGAAARRCLVHRDIKPANIMIAAERDEDGVPVVKVIDFGLVRSASCSHETNRFVGTPLYASPEQAEEREVDSRSDIYSLGCVLWFLHTGRPPFTGSLANVFAQHLNCEPPWELLGSASPAVRELIRRMLQKNPAKRHHDPFDLRKEIEECLRISQRRQALVESVARPVSSAGKWFASRPQGRIGALAAATVLASLMGFATVRVTRADKQVADADAANSRVADSLEEVGSGPPPSIESTDTLQDATEPPFWTAEFARQKLVGSDRPSPLIGEADTYDDALSIESDFEALTAAISLSRDSLWDAGAPTPIQAANPRFAPEIEPFSDVIVLNQRTDAQGLEAPAAMRAAKRTSRESPEIASAASLSANASESDNIKSNKTRKERHRTHTRDRDLLPIFSNIHHKIDRLIGRFF